MHWVSAAVILKLTSSTTALQFGVHGSPLINVFACAYSKGLSASALPSVASVRDAITPAGKIHQVMESPALPSRWQAHVACASGPAGVLSKFACSS